VCSNATDALLAYGAQLEREFAPYSESKEDEANAESTGEPAASDDS
jgi:hypothetical protein